MPQKLINNGVLVFNIIQLNSDDKPIIINDVEDDTVVELVLPIKTY